MNNLIQHLYKKAVAGLNEELLENKSDWYLYIEGLPANLRTVYCVAVFHNQVMNGGLHQYFFNSYGQFAYLTLDCLKTINAHQNANILCKALKKVNSDNLPIDIFRRKIAERTLEKIVDFDLELGDYLDALDTKYYDLKEDLEELLYDHLK